MKTQKLLRMKERVSEIAIDIAKIQGKLEDRRKQLQKKTGNSKLIEVEVVLNKLKKKIDKKESELEKGIEKLEEKYDW